MSTVADDLVRRAERGQRVKQIREALEMTGERFAAELNRIAKGFGLRLRYDTAKISRLENGGRKLTAEEVAILVMMDPRDRGVPWLVFGDASKAATRDRFRKIAG